MNQLAIEYIDINDLQPFVGNPRKIEPSEMVKLKRSLREFGFVDPVIARKENKQVIGGHQRIEAAKAEHWTDKIPVVFIEGLSDNRAALLNVALNKISGEWDWSKLGTLFHELDTGDIDLTLSGFDMDEIGNLMHGLDESSKQMEDAIGGLPSGDGSGFRQMTFILSNDQADCVFDALEIAKKKGNFIDTGNENSNGNALARVAEHYCG